MFDRLAAQCARLPFLGRLLITASFALLVAGSAMLLVSARQEALDSRADLAAELANELETLPATLAEVVVIGDFSTLQQTLDRFVSRPHVYRVAYLDGGGSKVVSRDNLIPARTPDWFMRAFDFTNLSGKTLVDIGGRVYGELELELTAQTQAQRAWSRLLHHLAILLLAVGLDFLGIWLVLRNGLAPLKQLEAGANALAGGQLETRLQATGSPEMRHLIAAFNHMASVIQSTQENLARSNAELHRFAEIAAHHLQEPARRLASFAQRLRSQIDAASLNEEAQLSLDFIEQQARRQQFLVRDVQRYLAAGQPRGNIGQTDSDAILRDVLHNLQPRIEQVGARIECSPLPPACIDAARLAELFNALIDNALSHGVEGQPTIMAIRGEIRQYNAFFQFSDNGPGIAPAYRERVFRVFERLSAQGSGTGVGLAIVRRILESVGGRVWITETQGGGCTVNFEIPMGAYS